MKQRLRHNEWLIVSRRSSLELETRHSKSCTRFTQFVARCSAPGRDGWTNARVAGRTDMVGACAPKGRAKFCGRCRYITVARAPSHRYSLSLFLFLSSQTSLLSLGLSAISVFFLCIFLYLPYRRDCHARPRILPPSLPSFLPDSFHLCRSRCSRFDSSSLSHSALAPHPLPLRFFFTDPLPLSLIPPTLFFLFFFFCLSFPLFLRASSSAAASAPISDA